MLRMDNSIMLVKAPFEPGLLLRGRWSLARGDRLLGPRWRRRRAEALLLAQAQEPVALLEQDARTLWAFRDRFYWEDEGLAHEDVAALVAERERRARRRLERAHALMASERADSEGPVAVALRTGISLEIKRRVWERCGGRCVECGSDQLLEFDHVIPLAMGGSSTERNLQLLCAPCNRSKGDSL
jgi:hypothetical protein